MNTMFTTLLAAAGARVEIPVDGSTGVWFKQGATVISSGMRMTGAAISSGQSQRIYNRGVAVSCFVGASGTQYVSSGGTAIDNVQSDGTVQVYRGGVVSHAIKYAGPLNILSGGYGKDLAISGGGFVIYDGGSGDDITIQIPSSYIPVINGHATNLTYYNTPGSRLEIRGTSAIVSNFALRGGVCWCFSRGAIQTGIISGGYLYVFNSGSAADLTISSGGNASVYTGATLSGAFVQSAAKLTVVNAGVVYNPVIASAGSLVVGSGGTALAVTSSAGAIIVVSDGGYIEYA